MYELKLGGRSLRRIQLLEPYRRLVDSLCEENVMPRELIDTGTDKRFVRRDEEGKFKESADVGHSLAADRRQHAKTKVKKGEGDRGDR